MSRMWFDEDPGEQRMSSRGELERLRGVGGRASQETENRFEKVRDSVDRSSDNPAWREDHLDLIRALLKSSLGDVDDDDAGEAMDQNPDSVAARFCDPARSRLNRTIGGKNPSRWIR